MRVRVRVRVRVRSLELIATISHGVKLQPGFANLDKDVKRRHFTHLVVTFVSYDVRLLRLHVRTAPLACACCDYVCVPFICVLRLSVVAALACT